MRLISILFLLLGLGGYAHAGLDVECINGDCLTYGWDTMDMKNGDSSGVECTNLDCLTEGWVSTYKGQETVEVICKAPGCFQEGWRAFDVRTGRQLANVNCMRSFADGSDCLRNGWETIDVNIGRFTTVCEFGNCAEFGWETRAPGYQPQLARCKEGGCFQSGWTTRP